MSNIQTLVSEYITKVLRTMILLDILYWCETWSLSLPQGSGFSRLGYSGQSTVGYRTRIVGSGDKWTNYLDCTTGLEGRDRWLGEEKTHFRVLLNQISKKARVSGQY